MPTPSEHTRLSVEARLGERARTTWPQTDQLHVRHRGAFACVEAELAHGTASAVNPPKDLRSRPPSSDARPHTAHGGAHSRRLPGSSGVLELLRRAHR
jgi:hypothetical protein